MFNSLPKLLRIEPGGVSTPQGKVYEEFSVFHSAPGLHPPAHIMLGSDPKRRVFTSRPNSTVSYSRADQIQAFSPPPVPEQSGALLRPQEAMERFNVGVISVMDEDHRLQWM